MHFTKNSRLFVQKNRSEIASLVRYICYKLNVTWIDDAIQDIYLYIIQNDLMQKFDKNRGSLSTFLYIAISNIIIVQKRSVHQKIIDSSIELPANFTKQSGDYIDTIINAYKIQPEYMNMIMQNQDSDSLEGIGFDLKMFSESYLKKRNTLYGLRKRRNKKADGGVCSMKIIYKCLFEGVSGHELASKYGVSCMFISSIKHDIAQALRRYGLEKKSKKQRRRHGSDKVPQV